MSRSAKIFYHCYDTERRRGGQKSVYQHVDVLNQNGYEAFVVHSEAGYRIQWFDNNTRVISGTEFWRMFDPEYDYLVLPEDMGPRIMLFPGKKVVFNKNLFYGFSAIGGKPYNSDPYLSRGVVAAMTVSDHNCRNLRFAYPQLTVFRVWEHIDSSIFAFRSLKGKKRQIAYIPKSELTLRTIYRTFVARARAGLNGCSDVPWIALEHMTERETAQVLQESIAFVFASVEEGLGRTPLEAMLSGCLVFAHGNGPIPEYLPKSLCFEYGDAIGIVQEIEHLLHSNHPDSVRRFSNLVYQSVQNALRYNAEQQRQSVCAAWEQILAA
jgi:glycosyltransferase involved in cell wall biosynthesis